MEDRAKVIEELRAYNRRMTAPDTDIIRFVTSESSHLIAARAAAQIEADGTEIERLNATIHGMQDGALVRDQAALIGRIEAENERLRSILERCRTVLGNMADEYEDRSLWKSTVFGRWKISDEPLRHDAKNLLPVIAAALEPTGCPTPGACSCPDGAGDVVSGRLEWRGDECWIGKIYAGYIQQRTPDDGLWCANCFVAGNAKRIGKLATESEARSAVEQAVRAAIAGGKGET